MASQLFQNEVVLRNKNQCLVVIILHKVCCCNTTYTVVPCVQKVEQLFCAVLSGVGAGVDAGLALLQLRSGVNTMLRLLTCGSY